ncbi:MAG: pilus assembly protein PilO [Oxalobacter sp.]|nr:MAG: pilus assembly protein PilO [Oxalobacter sp.]
MATKLKNISHSFTAQFTGLKGRPPEQWPIIPQLFCAFGVLSLVLAAGWFGYVSSQMESLDRGVQEESKLKDAYKIKIQQAVNLEALSKQKDLVNQYVLTMEKQLPSKAEMDALLSDINQAGVGRGLQFELFKPGQVVVKEYYAELPIQIKVSGGYHDIASFMSDIANLPRIVTLNNLNIVVNKDGKLGLDAIAKTFRYLDQVEIEAQRKAKSKVPAKKGGKK